MPTQDELTLLASRANREHEAGLDAMAKGLEHYRAAGAALKEAREECRRQGIGFTAWLKETIQSGKLTFRRARAYHYIALDDYLVTRPNATPEVLV
jgi:hypothetical protein